MRHIGLFLIISVFTIGIKAQNIPEVYTNIGQDKHGVFLKKGESKIYATPAENPYQFTDLYGHPEGNKKGIALDFNYSGLNGTLYYGFINYGDAKYPQPVFFKETASIDSGKTFINIAEDMDGKYDMIGWEESGQGVLGYRIVTGNGDFLYDGKVAFSYRDNAFKTPPTLIEGPFVTKLQPRSAVIDFTTTRPVKATVKIDGKKFSDQEAVKDHEIAISGLNPSAEYSYTVQVRSQQFTYTIETKPEKGSREPFTFAYASDSRAGRGGGERSVSGTNAYIMKKIAALAREENARFMQFTGDLINGYQNSKERMHQQYANWKHAAEPFWHHFPIYPAFGNHEAYNYFFRDKDEQKTFMIDHFPFGENSAELVFRDNFTNPENGPVSEDGSEYDPNASQQDFPSYKETVYHYTYANAAMVVLNSDYWYAPAGHETTSGNIHGYIMDKQLEWLRKTMQKLENDGDIDHVFVTLHTPFFPNGGHVGDDMWYGGNNDPRPVVAGKEYEQGIIQRRDALLDILVNKSQKTLALLTGDEHNYNLLTITDTVERYPDNYQHEKLELSRTFYQINNGAAGAPYYAREKTPWMEHVSNFSTQNALVLFDIEGQEVHVRVKNPDTMEKIDEYTLRE